MTTRTVSLVKGGHKYVFRYSSGCEDEVVDEIMRLAKDPQTGIEWLDAATLSFQVTQYAAAGCFDALAAESQNIE